MSLVRFLRKQDWFKTLLFYALRLVPIKKEKIVFCNFSGKRCGDSPRSISDMLQEKHPDWDIVWLIHPDYKAVPPPKTRTVTFGMHSLKMIYELATAKVWVDSHTKFKFTRKRAGQFYMETWHGGIGLKKVEGDAANVLDKPYLDRVHNNSKMADLFLSNSEWCSKLYRRAFWYQGDFLTYGLPRNDGLVKSPRSKKVHQAFGIADNTKILLYAPTFRANQTTDCYHLDTEALLKALQQKTQDHWKILIRLHPMVMQQESPIRFSEDVLNATPYPDMQELLIESDCLISDYSSCLFDYAILNRPAFLFATDIPEYKKDRDLYFDLHTLPFPLAESNQDLCQNIQAFNEEEYRKTLVQFCVDVGLNETGTATEKAVEQIEAWVESKQ